MVIRATPDISKTALESKERARDPFNINWVSTKRMRSLKRKGNR